MRDIAHPRQLEVAQAMTADEQGSQSIDKGDVSKPSLDSILDRLQELGSSAESTGGAEPAWEHAGTQERAPDRASFPIREDIDTQDPEPIQVERIDVDFRSTAIARPPEVPPAPPAAAPEDPMVVKPAGGFSFRATPQPDEAWPEEQRDSPSEGASATGALVQLDEYRTPDLANFDFGLPDPATGPVETGLNARATTEIAEISPDVDRPATADDVAGLDAEVIDIKPRLNKPASTPLMGTPPPITPPPIPLAEWSLLPDPDREKPPRPSHIETWSLETDQSMGYADGAPAFVQPLEKTEIDRLRPHQGPGLSRTIRPPIMIAIYVLVPIVVLIAGWWLAIRS